MRVLVVGGAGYIGSHTALALADAGYEPIVYDNLDQGHARAVQWGPLVEADLRNTELLARTMADFNIAAVIHFAAHIDVGESVRNPRTYFENNVVGSFSLLNAMLEASVRDIIFSSSAGTYGIPERVPIDETHPQHPISPYGDSKLFIERALKWYGQAYDLNWVALRYFNAAGADLQGRIGESHDPETHLIPLVIDAALGKRGPVKIFGTDYPTPDGTAIRDYIHVLDLADAHIRALEYLRDGGSSQAFNLGNGRGYSVREVLATVERISGRDVPYNEAPRRPGDPPELIADARRAIKTLGWCVRYPDLDQIVESAWRWHSRSE